MSGMYGSEVRRDHLTCMVVKPSNILGSAPGFAACQPRWPVPAFKHALSCVAPWCLSPCLCFSHVGLHPLQIALRAQECTTSCLCPRQALFEYGQQQVGTAGFPGLQVPEVIAAYREAGNRLGSAPWTKHSKLGSCSLHSATMHATGKPRVTACEKRVR